jgi:endonuclease YncB( thermonuclease family)
VFVAISAIVGSAQAVHAQQPSRIEARVSKVLGGDTFTLRGETRRIRI